SAPGLKAANTSCSAFASPGIARPSFAVFVFQNSIPPSWCAEISTPLESNASAITLDILCFKLQRSRSDSVGHRHTVPSELPEASQRLSGLNANASMEDVCPGREYNSCPVATSQTFTVRSLLPEASHRPLRLAASDLT